MRIALYLAGHIRGGDRYRKIVIKAIKELMKDHEYDVFISTHYANNRPGLPLDITYTLQDIQTMYSELPVRGIEICEHSEPLCLTCRKNVAKYTYKLTVVFNGEEMISSPTHCSECCKSSDIREDMVEQTDNSSWSMWRHVWSCYNMSLEYEKTIGIKYDYHIRSRPDIVLISKINFEELPSLTDQIIIGFGGTFGYPDDQFAIGSGEVWKYYCDLDKVLKYSVFAHYITKDIIQKYNLYKFYQICRLVYHHPSNALTPVTIHLDDEIYITGYYVESYIQDKTKLFDDNSLRESLKQVIHDSLPLVEL